MPDDALRLVVTSGPDIVTVDIDVRCGGRVRQVRIAHGDDGVDLLASSPDVGRPAATSWGSFPMAPWAGRLRHGRFAHDGVHVGLELNHQDGGTDGTDGTDGGADGGGTIDPPASAPSGLIDTSSREARRHAIHGTTFQRPWSVDSAGPDSCELHCPIDTVAGWPFPGVARQVVRVHPDRIEFTLSVESGSVESGSVESGSVEPEREVSFPSTLGWHPWFVKPDRLDASPTAMYVRDAIGLPTGELINPPPGPWDDCFLNRDPVRLVYGRSLAAVVTVSSDCDHLVLYDQPEHATCVEPQSGPPDAFNLQPEVVSPGSPLRRTMTWSWSSSF